MAHNPMWVNVDAQSWRQKERHNYGRGGGLQVEMLLRKHVPSKERASSRSQGTRRGVVLFSLALG